MPPLARKETSENDLKEEKYGGMFKTYQAMFYSLLAHLPFKRCA
jgi:hypothetical protein